jgi:cysteine desulfurase
MHTDAAQSVGKVPARVDELDVDLLSVAGHKLYGPKGVGALYVRRGTPIEPWVRGAGHEGGRRPGTENVAGIAGLGAACDLARRTLDEEAARQRALRDQLWMLLREQIPSLALNGHPSERLPNTLNVSFPAVRGSAILDRAPQIAASGGAACHEGGEEQPSAVLTAMGLGPEEALGAVRLSLGRATSAEEVRCAAQALCRAYGALTG